MTAAQIPPNETQRIQELHKLKLLDTEPNDRFDKITNHASLIFSAPISTISLVDSDREWYKACHGSQETEKPRSISFCSHTILSNEVLIVEDTLQDPRFKDNPMVVNSPHIRFYAGAPIYSENGFKLGAFCIKDTQPHTMSETQIAALLSLARWTEAEIYLFAAKTP